MRRIVRGEVFTESVEAVRRYEYLSARDPDYDGRVVKVSARIAELHYVAYANIVKLDGFCERTDSVVVYYEFV